MPLRWNRFPDRFTIIFSAIAGLLFIAESINGRLWLNDFRVYYGAASALLNGDPLYGVAHGLDSGLFKYAPVMALFYVPFALLPYSLAASIQYVLITGVFIGAILRMDRAIRAHLFPTREGLYMPLFLTALVVVVHLHRELHLGNINVLLLGLLIVGLDDLLCGKPSRAGVLLGLASLAKPHFLVLLPLLLMRGYWRSSALSVFTVVAGLMAPALVLGPHASWTLHQEWLGEMAKHNAALIYTGGNAYNAVDTVYSFLHRALLQHILPGTDRTEVYVVLGVIAVATGALVLHDLRAERKGATNGSSFLLEFFIILALVPSITLTDTNHFLFSTPLVMVVMAHTIPKAQPSWLRYAAIPVFLAYGGNWADALGPLSDRMVHYGILGIANMGLILIGSVLLLQRSNLRAAAVSP